MGRGGVGSARSQRGLRDEQDLSGVEPGPELAAASVAAGLGAGGGSDVLPARRGADAGPVADPSEVLGGGSRVSPVSSADDGGVAVVCVLSRGVQFASDHAGMRGAGDVSGHRGRGQPRFPDDQRFPQAAPEGVGGGVFFGGAGVGGGRAGGGGGAERRVAGGVGPTRDASGEDSGGQESP